MANSVLGEKGELLKYWHLIGNPKTKVVWAHSYGNKIGRLAQGMPGRNTETNTIFFIQQDQVPHDRMKDTTYGLITCLVFPETIYKPNRTRLVAGGDWLLYLGVAGMPTADNSTAHTHYSPTKSFWRRSKPWTCNSTGSGAATLKDNLGITEDRQLLDKAPPRKPPHSVPSTNSDVAFWPQIHKTLNYKGHNYQILRRQDHNDTKVPTDGSKAAYCRCPKCLTAQRQGCVRLTKSHWKQKSVSLGAKRVSHQEVSSVALIVTRYPMNKNIQETRREGSLPPPLVITDSRIEHETTYPLDE
jgi:hypothetical protein